MMMRTHLEGMTRSPDGDGTGGGSSSGQPQGDQASGQPQGQPLTASDMVPRAMLHEVIGGRDAAKERARAAEETAAAAQAQAQAARERVNELERMLAAKGGSTTQPPASVPADDLSDRLAKIEAGIKARERDERERMLLTAVQGHVPARAHSMVGALVRDMHRNGVPDGDVNDIAAASVASLKTNHPSLFEPAPGSSRTANQIGPDGKLDWSTITSIHDVPAGIKIPDAEYARLRTNGPQGNALVLGTRRTRPPAQ